MRLQDVHVLCFIQTHASDATKHNANAQTNYQLQSLGHCHCHPWIKNSFKSKQTIRNRKLIQMKLSPQRGNKTWKINLVWSAFGAAHSWLCHGNCNLQLLRLCTVMRIFHRCTVLIELQHYHNIRIIYWIGYNLSA